MAILVRLALIVRYRRALPFARRVARQIFRARLGFNMWKSSRGYRRLIASCYFPPTGKTGKPAARWIAIDEKGRETAEACDRARVAATGAEAPTVR